MTQSWGSRSGLSRRRGAAKIRAFAASDQGRKWLRYALVSGLSVVISQAVIAVVFGMMHASAQFANLWAVILSTIPAYYLTRAWAWQKRGRSQVMREVVPFWAMTFAGLVLSTWSTGFAERRAHAIALTRAETTMVVMGASIASYGALWVVKFVIIERLMFVDRAAAGGAAALRSEGSPLG